MAKADDPPARATTAERARERREQKLADVQEELDSGRMTRRQSRRRRCGSMPGDARSSRPSAGTGSPEALAAAPTATHPCCLKPRSAAAPTRGSRASSRSPPSSPTPARAVGPNDHARRGHGARRRRAGRDGANASRASPRRCTSPAPARPGAGRSSESRVDSATDGRAVPTATAPATPQGAVARRSRQR